jgi:hypothetical protein
VRSHAFERDIEKGEHNIDFRIHAHKLSLSLSLYTHTQSNTNQVRNVCKVYLFYS